ncbi:MAG: hypothetical protein ACTS73_02310 [Arsenophonus sp. NEOnobi-MAG3]
MILSPCFSRNLFHPSSIVKTNLVGLGDLHLANLSYVLAGILPEK